MKQSSHPMLGKLARRTALALALAAIVTPAAAQEFYRGKTINCIVPYPAGGATDVFFRTIAPFMSKHTAGNPQIIIQNMAGAGGIVGNNFVYDQARPDGLTVLCAPWLSLAQVTKSEGVRFEYQKMRLIGAHRAVNTALVASSLIEKPEDIVKKPFKMAGLAPSSSIDLRTRMALDLVGANYSYVAGFAGDATQRPALQRGEVHVIGQNYGTYLSNIKKSIGPDGDKTVKPLWYYPFYDDKGNPMSVAEAEKEGFERFDKVFEKIKGAPPSGELWEMFKWSENLSAMISLSMWLPPKSPDAAHEALKAAWVKVGQDPEFQKEYATRFGGEPLIFASDSEMKAALEALEKLPPRFVERLRDMIEKGGK
jgi:tripartite-type tricarboxylate transporter receptor subunit TctC